MVVSILVLQIIFHFFLKIQGFLCNAEILQKLVSIIKFNESRRNLICANQDQNLNILTIKTSLQSEVVQNLTSNVIKLFAY
jgi:hypothetical protein